MTTDIILASTSEIRQSLLLNAGVVFMVEAARVDEDSIRLSLQSEDANPTSIVDALAEAKARKISQKHPNALIIGCDQVLEFGREIFTKPVDIVAARRQLSQLNGKKHKLLSAVVIYQNGQPQWRHIGVARMHMREVSQEYLDEYLTRNWESIRGCVGCYKLEEEGVRLFERVEGDYFTVLGLPLTELLGYLMIRGALKS